MVVQNEVTVSGFGYKFLAADILQKIKEGFCQGFVHHHVFHLGPPRANCSRDCSRLSSVLVEPHINRIVPRHPHSCFLLPHVSRRFISVYDLLSFLHVPHQGSKEITFLHTIIRIGVGSSKMPLVPRLEVADVVALVNIRQSDSGNLLAPLFLNFLGPLDKREMFLELQSIDINDPFFFFLIQAAVLSFTVHCRREIIDHTVVILVAFHDPHHSAVDYVHL